jgi:hypothetical protein
MAGDSVRWELSLCVLQSRRLNQQKGTQRMSFELNGLPCDSVSIQGEEIFHLGCKFFANQAHDLLK